MVFKLVMAAAKTWRRLKGRKPVADDHCRCQFPKRHLGHPQGAVRLVHTAHRLALDGETLRKPPENTGKAWKT
jgi:hypothetical protein